MKMLITKRQWDNLLEAENMWLTVPPRNVAHNLNFWRIDNTMSNAPTCGTVACFGGWCAWWPAFRKQGVNADKYGAPVISGKNVQLTLFGSCGLFAARNQHEADWESGTSVHDWEVVMRRIRWAMQNSEVAL